MNRFVEENLRFWEDPAMLPGLTGVTTDE